MTPERLAAAADETVGRTITLDAAVLAAALDPAACAEARRQTGSSSQAALGEMLDGLADALAAHAAWSGEARAREANAEAALLARARALA